MAFNTLTRPQQVHSDAQYNIIYETWEHIIRNSENTPIGKYTLWYKTGQLLAEGEYRNDDGDTQTFKGYSDKGELYIEASIEKGIPATIYFYKCKGDTSKWNAYQSDLNRYDNEKVHHIEQSGYEPDLYELYAYKNFKNKTWYDEAGNVLLDRSYDRAPYTDQDNHECQIYSALKRGNFAVAQRRFEEYGLTEKYKDIYQHLIDYMPYASGERPVTEETINTLLGLTPSAYFHPQKISLITLVRTIATFYIAANPDNSQLIVDTLYRLYKMKWINLPLEYFTYHYMQLIEQKKFEELKEIAATLWENSYRHSKAYPHLLPLLELSIVYLAKAGKITPAHDDYDIVRRLLYIEKQGARTSISDFILETDDYKDYIHFLQNIDRNYTYNEEEQTLTYDKDLQWDGAFDAEDIPFYYPELEGKEIKQICINGNFTLKSKFADHRWGKSYHIKGTLTAPAIEIHKNTIIVQKGIKAEKYVYFDDITIEPLRANNTKAEIKGMIDTPLFVFEHMQFRHRRGFRPGCIIIGTNPHCIKYIREKAHVRYNLREDISNSSNAYAGINLQKLVDAFGKGENIFKEGYDPNATHQNPALLKLQPAYELFLDNRVKEVEQIFKSVSYKEYKDNETAKWLMLFYEAYLFYQKDKDKYAKKIQTACKTLLKELKEMDNSQPRWGIILFAADYMINVFEQAGEHKKALDLLTQFNRGDEAYYVRKVKLLQQLGKPKELLFPAYMAISHYNSKQLADIAQNEDYKKYIAAIKKSAIPPKGSKNSYQNHLSKVRTISCYFEEEEAMTVYKGDVYWNGELKLFENTHESSGNYEFGKLVVLGDLYINGNLDLFQTDIFVQGNIFADEIYLCDMTLECTGNLFVRDRITILSDIHGTEGAIHGNLTTPVFISDAEDFTIYGNIAQDTLCIGLKGYRFDGYNPTHFHAYENDVYEFTSLSKEQMQTYIKEKKLI